MKHFIIIASLLLSSCTSEDKSDISTPYWEQDYPTFMGNNIPIVSRNPLTTEGVELGRMLFYDPILSADSSVSCASCHFLALAFADGVALTNKGFSTNTLKRNSPALFNLAWHDGLFWEGGAIDVESQVAGPILDIDELGGDPQKMMERLNHSADYKARFQKAFGKENIEIGDVAKAIAQFERTIVSYQSTYDQYKEGNATLSTQELQGLHLYRAHCASCHTKGFFSDFDYHNNGLDSTFDFTDPEDIRWGRYRITLNEKDKGAYKTPSLRNIALTAPYMHDGRFATLEEVLTHYSHGIVASNTLDSSIPKQGFGFSSKEQEDIIAFLHSLTDYQLITNPHYQNPFEH